MGILLYIAGGFLGLAAILCVWAWLEIKKASHAHELWPEHLLPSKD